MREYFPFYFFDTPHRRHNHGWLFAALTLVALPQQGAQAANNRSKPDKVTICHRTHSTTNPYRMITVSTSAVDGDLHTPTSGNEPQGGSGDHAGYVHNKVTQGSGQNPDVHNAPSASKLFGPSYAYPANQKIWEDIIPPFSVVRQNTTLKYPGMNWTDIGKAIFYGQSFGGVDYSGLCGKSGAKEFAQSEYDSWLADNPNATDSQKSAKRQEIIDDLKEQENLEDPTFTGSETIENLPSVPKKPKGPNKPTRLSTLQANLDTNNAQNNNPVKQALAGVVWKDLNNNGVQDNGEAAFESVGIIVRDPVTGQELTDAQLGLTSGVDYSLASYRTAVKEPAFSFANFITGSATFRTIANVVTVTTDANGYFEIPLLPDGEWQVVVSTPDGWSYTYDSSGTNDGDMPGTIVPVGGVGFAWAGLIYTGSGTLNADGTVTNSDGSVTNADGTVTASLSNTGVNGQWYIAGVVGIELIATGALLMWLRRRSQQQSRASAIK